MKKTAKRFRILNGDWVDVGSLVEVRSVRFDSMEEDTWLGMILPTELHLDDQKKGWAETATIYGRPRGLNAKAWIVPTRWVRKI
jgi:hypothetical protein